MHKIKVRWIIKKENKLFLVREIKKHFYYLPWWTLDQNESFKDCLKREFFEEFWINAKIWELITIKEFENDEKFYLDVWFEIKNYKDFENIDKSKTTHGFEYYDKWFYDLEELKWKDLRPWNLKELLNEKIILL